jgi:diguanylate cyclase (GGDEF)-like protein/PAS domain S-box-containing protein
MLASCGEGVVSEDHGLRRLLIADDEASVASALKKNITVALGCHVDVVHDGDAVLEALDEGPYDVLVTDMVMPGCHGMELVRRVVKGWPSIDILVMTAYAEDFAYADAVAAGARDFICKPFQSDEMRARLLRIFQERDLHERLEHQHHQVLADMEELRQTRASQAVAEAKYRSLFEHSMNGMLLASVEEYRILEVNEALSDMIGRPADELVDQPFLGLLAGEGVRRLEQALPVMEEHGRGTIAAVSLLRADGTALYLDISVTFLTAASERFVQVVCKDVSEQYAMHEQLDEAVRTDPMTGLLNRRTLEGKLQQAIAQAREKETSTCLLFIDLDNFKQCNDTHGHQTGDDLLKLVGTLIRKHTRVAKGVDDGFRFGGDEFAVLLRNADAAIGVMVGERIRLEYEGGDRFGTSMSMGVAQHKEGMDVAAFIRTADEALYEAKSSGKNTIHVA